MFSGAYTPGRGREPLDPLLEAEVLVRFMDGTPAVIRRQHGKGQAYLVGVSAGAEYRGDAGSLSYVAAPALERVTPPLEVSEPRVEGILIRNPRNGKRAIVLINWDYEGKSGPGTPNVRITIRRPRDLAVDSAFSVAMARSVTAKQSDGGPALTLPDLHEVDILLLE